jgi:predicted O-methyltransferase YrrM
MRRIARYCLPLIDVVFVPLALAASLTMKMIRRAGIKRLPRTRAVFRKVGVYPILDHYYEPLFNPAHLRTQLAKDRDLPGIDWNVAKQLDLLKKFTFHDELVRFPLLPPARLGYYYQNGAFESGDAEFLYSMIRLFKPRRIVEIGSGQSTLLSASAVSENCTENPNYSCEHICIEPYENQWLDQLNIQLVRQPVEQLDLSLFSTLQRDDILFIDSSHMVRPQGDVIFELFEILPALNPGVLIHIHDIFSPRDYLEEWITTEMRFWNEQYLLEAFLSYNSSFEILGALNFLKHHYPAELSDACPVLREQFNNREPGSFWLRRR